MLQARKNNDPFTPSFIELEEELEFSSSIRLDDNLLKVVNIDEWAYEPLRPIKPMLLERDIVAEGWQ